MKQNGQFETILTLHDVKVSNVEIKTTGVGKIMHKKILTITQAALVAAAYVALTMVIQPIGYGPLQFRVAEALTILPVYMPAAIPGLTVGCFLSNLIGLSSGLNPAGGWDLLVGTGATLIAALLSYRFRSLRFKNLPLLATLPPVVINAVAIGLELALVYGGLPWYWHVAGVAAGQFVACCLCGTVLSMVFNRMKRS